MEYQIYHTDNLKQSQGFLFIFFEKCAKAKTKNAEFREFQFSLLQNRITKQYTHRPKKGIFFFFIFLIAEHIACDEMVVP